MSEQNTTCCPCEPKQPVLVPVTFGFGIDPSAFGGMSREEIAQIIREELQNLSLDNLARPDLEIGVEVKLNQRFQGKQVYAQLIDFGALPNNSIKKVNHNIPDVDWIHVDPTYSYVTNNNVDDYKRGISYAHPSSVTGSWGAGVDKTTVFMGTGINRTNMFAVICVNYTKTTDTAM